MSRWLLSILARIGITIHAHEISIQIGKTKITIKLEHNGNEDTQRHIERKKK